MGLLSQILCGKGMDVEIYHSSSIDGVVGAYNRDLARAGLMPEKWSFDGWYGQPLFYDDTAACLRAIELDVEAVLKATSVDGVYSADPTKNKDAYRYETLGISSF